MNAFTMIACFPIFPGASLSLQLGQNVWEIAKVSTNMHSRFKRYFFEVFIQLKV